MNFLRGLTLACGLICLASSTSQATDYTNFTLIDGNSSVSIMAHTMAGMNGWTVDSIPQLYRQSFFYRNGSSGGERYISELALISAEQNSPSTLTTLYRRSGQFSIEISYALQGGLLGSGFSTIGEQIKITNLSGNLLNFHFFQFADFDLGDSPGNDTVVLGQNLSGLYDTAYQNQGTSFFADEIVSPGAQHAETALLASLHDRLADNSPTTLNGNIGPLTGDVTWAFQWDAAIPVGGSFSIELNKRVYITPIPEPSALALIPAALALLAVARRRLNSGK